MSFFAATEGIPQDCLDPITKHIMTDPVKASDGMIYDRPAITNWMKVYKELNPAAASIPSPVKPDVALQGQPKADKDTEAIAKKLKDIPAGREIKMLSSPIFSDLDKIAELPLMKERNLEVPRFVTIGNESAGKSTVLERLIGFAVLPKRTGLCTRMPIHVILRRSKDPKPPRVEIYSRTQGTPIANTAKIGILDYLCELVQQTMDDHCAKHKASTNLPIVKDDEIRITISVPYCPDLDILDLPGLALRTEGVDVEALTKSIVEEVIAEEEKHKRAFYLLVCEAGMRGNMAAVCLVQKNPNLKPKTIGILTKIDNIRRRSDFADVEKPDHFFADAAACWFYTASIPQGEDSDSDEDTGAMTYQNSFVVETGTTGAEKYQTARLGRFEFMEQLTIEKLKEKVKKDRASTPPRRTISEDQLSRFGMPKVRAEAKRLFEQYIAVQWAGHLIKQLVEEFEKLIFANVELGLPMIQDPKYTSKLATLRELLPFVKANEAFEDLFPVEQNTELIRILQRQVKLTIGNENDDWMQFGQMKELQELLTDFSTYVSAKRTQWGYGAMPYQNALSETAEAKAMLFQKLDAIIKLLASLANSDLAQKLRTTIANRPRKNIKGVGVFSSLKALLFSRKQQTPANDADDDITGLGSRFEPLMVVFEQHLNSHFKATSSQFSEVASEFSRKVQHDGVEIEFVQGAQDTCQVVMTPGIEHLPHRIVQCFFEIVVQSIEDSLKTISIPANISENASIRSKREGILTDMIKVAEVVAALKQLQTKIGVPVQEA